MSKLYKNEKGFSAFEIILVIVLVALIGAVSWLVYKDHHKTTAVNTTNNSTKSTTANPYAGWNSCTDNSEGITIKYPSTWKATGASSSNGQCSTNGNYQLTQSPLTNASPNVFTVSYTEPTNFAGSTIPFGAYDGDKGQVILSVTPLTIYGSKTPLYLVAFHESASSDDIPNQVFEFVLTSEKYTIGQSLDYVRSVQSQKISGDYYGLSVSLAPPNAQYVSVNDTLTQWEEQPGYSDMIKIFESVSY